MRRPAEDKARITTVEEYLASLSDDKRAALEKLRATILAVVPRAEECISYQLPAVRLDGKVLVWFGAAARHCAFYPGGIVESFKDELEDFETSKGTIRFQPDHPLPASLVRKLINARIAKHHGPRSRLLSRVEPRLQRRP